MKTGACPLCNSRKARRSCPAAQADICSQCCGEQREEQLDCPLDCPHLREARHHDKLPARPDGAVTPHAEVRVTEDFLNRNDVLLQYLFAGLSLAARRTPGLTDADLREALDALIQTLKTANSGLIYESKPTNPYAASVQQELKDHIDSLRTRLAEAGEDPAKLRDKDVLGTLVFTARAAYSLDNGRRKCRAFLSMLDERFPIKASAAAARTGESALAPADTPSGLIIAP